MMFFERPKKNTKKIPLVDDMPKKFGTMDIQTNISKLAMVNL